MADAALRKQIEQEIEEAKASLDFWRNQSLLQRGTDFGAVARAVADGRFEQLQHLQRAREVLDDA